MYVYVYIYISQIKLIVVLSKRWNMRRSPLMDVKRLVIQKADILNLIELFGGFEGFKGVYLISMLHFCQELKHMWHIWKELIRMSSRYISLNS